MRQHGKRVSAAFHTAEALANYPLKTKVLLDSAATIHVFNDRSRFEDWEEVQVDDDDYVLAGTAEVPIQGYGTVVLRVMGHNGPRRWPLRDVAFCDGFATSVVSFQTLRRQGYWWENKPPLCQIVNRFDQVICYITELHGQFVVESVESRLAQKLRNERAIFTATSPTTTGKRQRQRSKIKKFATGEGWLWHKQLSHSGPEAIAHLHTHASGATRG